MFRYWLNQNNSKIPLINLASLPFLDFEAIFMRLQNLGTFLTNKTTKRKRGQRQKRRRKEKTFSHLKYIYKIPHQCGVHRKPRLLNTTQIQRDGFVVVCLFVLWVCCCCLFVFVCCCCCCSFLSRLAFKVWKCTFIF